MTEKEFDNPITIRTIIELLGKPKKHISNTLKLIVNSIENRDNIIVVKKKFFEPVEKEGGLFTTFVELELKMKDLDSIVLFCFENLPASVEILEPASLQADARFLTGFFTDLLTRLHKIDDELKMVKYEKGLLNNKILLLIRNMVIVVLSSSKKNMPIDELSRRIGIPSKQLEPALEEWIREGFIVKDDSGYGVKR